MKLPRDMAGYIARWPLLKEVKYILFMTEKRIEYKEMPKGNKQDPYQRLEESVYKRLGDLTGVGTEIVLTPAPEHSGADYGVQVSKIAGVIGMNPTELAKTLAEQMVQEASGGFEQISAQGPYVNFRIEMGKFAPQVLDQVLTQGADYGKENVGKGIVVEIDMSSPNIAKRMTYGHLRSTVIGAALANLYEVMGFQVIKDNHIGDWGTQFGKLIAAMKRFDISEEYLMDSPEPIEMLQEIYVRFHDDLDEEKKKLGIQIRSENAEVIEKLKRGEKLDAETELKLASLIQTIDEVGREVMDRKKIGRDQLDMDKIVEDAIDRITISDLEREGREWFKKLEDGDFEARRLWELCVDLSMTEFQKIYDFLGVTFDTTKGESFYEAMLKTTVDEVRDSGVGNVSRDALVVDLSDQGLGSAMVLKSDGATLYMTRDIATALYRESHGVQKAIYVVGEDQKLYFKQLFAILQKMGHLIGENSTHIYFGMVSLPEGKMSTRKGRVILLKDVIDEGIKRVSETLKGKNSEVYADPRRREKIVKQIACGAIKWSDLSQDPKRSIVFEWGRALNMQGNSSVRPQYAAVRAMTILNSAGVNMQNLQVHPVENIYYTEAERELIKVLAEYPKTLKEALDRNAPYVVANYVSRLADAFNVFYDNSPVLKAESEALRISRLRMVVATAQVITNGLGILGIEVPEVM